MLVGNPPAEGVGFYNAIKNSCIDHSFKALIFCGLQLDLSFSVSDLTGPEATRDNVLNIITEKQKWKILVE